MSLANLQSHLSPALSNREFRAFQVLIQQQAGIFLAETKRPLLMGRLMRRLRELGVQSFGEYYERVLGDDGEELVRMLDCICTNETHFFREPQHFRLLEQRVIPEWRDTAAAGKRAKCVRAWSAGCSTGEEPYTLAMVIDSQLGAGADWDVEIWATDLSTRALDRARAAVWPIQKSEEIPPEHLKRYMLRGTGGQTGNMKAGQEIRSLVHFARVNLNEERYPLAGPFEVIFCRNVLIYFSPESRARVVQKLASQLAPGGYLFLGHAETLGSAQGTLRSVVPTVYQRGDKAR